MSQQYWDDIFAGKTAESLRYDLWLEPYLEQLRQDAERPVLDLGCGAGNNALYLYERGIPVIACDRSAEALKRVRERLPKVPVVQLDLLEPLPFGDAHAAAVVADLSLHYFHWADTVRILQEIRRVLKPGGWLLCRVNSLRDTEYGAGQGLELEPGLYEQDGRLKRFFEREQLEALFGRWHISLLEECPMPRYDRPKIAWTAAVQRD
ncbi:Methyltransferase domain-containing protein [Paenibacillus sp. UNCCL117]|uniref:class I SAM-dependent methyltransferase n=1 Tax=unclassified Paenibacillus TaxID=185978 RepID=UPI00088EE689|nr:MULTISPECIES: class I SAM-dependent methyltransferase [unclassified Paenibacillus]SDC47544.1 Methyltransferase domain-containing protein [Paenibacillus sp. cl123]SFW12106.1 Methyltransferase domain-containing protein [Paenibacillus sp. UNCCL117]